MEDMVSGLDAFLEWQERLQRFELSGVSIDAFCQQEDVAQAVNYARNQWHALRCHESMKCLGSSAQSTR